MSEGVGSPLSPSQCIVLLSGGIDSAACLQFFHTEGLRVRGLHVSHGQPALRQEAIASRSIAAYFRIPFSRVRLAGVKRKAAGEIGGRNALLVATALGELDGGATMVALGIHAGTPYYDCSARFMSTIQLLVDGYCDGRVRVVAPFLDWSKRAVWDFCIERRVPINLTYSCEQGLVQPCGGCQSCGDLETLIAVPEPQLSSIRCRESSSRLHY